MLVDRFLDQEAIEEKVTKLVNVGVPFFWVHFNDGILISCDDLYEKNRGGEVKEMHVGGMKS